MTTPCHCSLKDLTTQFIISSFRVNLHRQRRGYTMAVALLHGSRKDEENWLCLHCATFHPFVYVAMIYGIVARHCILWHFLLLQHKLECPAVSRGCVSGKSSHPSNAPLMQKQQQHNGLHSVDQQGMAGQPKQNKAMA